jgi:hypothetical protein
MTKKKDKKPEIETFRPFKMLSIPGMSVSATKYGGISYRRGGGRNER